MAYHLSPEVTRFDCKRRLRRARAALVLLGAVFVSWEIYAAGAAAGRRS